jgi:hypothetical protein
MVEYRLRITGNICVPYVDLACLIVSPLSHGSDPDSRIRTLDRPPDHSWVAGGCHHLPAPLSFLISLYISDAENRIPVLLHDPATHTLFLHLPAPLSLLIPSQMQNIPLQCSFPIQRPTPCSFIFQPRYHFSSPLRCRTSRSSAPSPSSDPLLALSSNSPVILSHLIPEQPGSSAPSQRATRTLCPFPSGEFFCSFPFFTSLLAALPSISSLPALSFTYSYSIKILYDVVRTLPARNRFVRCKNTRTKNL